MGELEEAGLVEQPHTSAGRVPTDKVIVTTSTISSKKLGFLGADLRAIDKCSLPAGRFRYFFGSHHGEDVSRALRALHHVGIVVSPSLAENRLSHIEFVQLSDKESWLF